MRLILFKPAVVALAIALSIAVTVNAQRLQECMHKCDVLRAKEIETAVKAYSDYKDPRRLEAIDKAQDNFFDVCNYRCHYPESA